MEKYRLRIIKRILEKRLMILLTKKTHTEKMYYLK